MKKAAKKDFISIIDATRSLPSLLNSAARLKKELKQGKGHLNIRPLKHKQIAMIFEKSSTRTRVSFEVAIHHLGADALYLNPGDLQLGRGETLSDTGRGLSKYVNGIGYRAYDNRMMKELASVSSIPVINALDDVEHPCQALADLLTIKEIFGKLRGLRLTYVGDGNNVCNSLMLASALTGMHFAAATPKGREPPHRLSEYAASIATGTGSRIEIVNDPKAAANKANILYTDVWVSMGQEAQKEEREKLFVPYQLNKQLLGLADRKAIVMHCLPAHRGLEITDDVIDGDQSVVFEQAENRLHTEKAVLLWQIGH